MSQGTPYTSAPPAKSDIHRGMWYTIIIIIMQPNRFIIIHEGVVKRFVIELRNSFAHAIIYKRIHHTPIYMYYNIVWDNEQLGIRRSLYFTRVQNNYYVFRGKKKIYDHAIKTRRSIDKTLYKNTVLYVYFRDQTRFTMILYTKIWIFFIYIYTVKMYNN